MAFALFARILRLPTGEGRTVKIAGDIHKGAMVFLHYEYTLLALFVALGAPTAIAAVVGALCSPGAGYIGMRAATRANVRTTWAAHTQGMTWALAVAFYGGSVMGMSVAALGLPGLLTVNAPPVVGFLLGPEALGGMLGGALLAGVLLVLTMAIAGGAWDTAKNMSKRVTWAARARTCTRPAWQAIPSVIRSRIPPVHP